MDNMEICIEDFSIVVLIKLKIDCVTCLFCLFYTTYFSSTLSYISILCLSSRQSDSHALHCNVNALY